MNFDQAEFDRNADILSELGVVGFTRDNDGTLGGWTPQQVKGLRYKVAQADKASYVTACNTLRDWLTSLEAPGNQTSYELRLLQQFMHSDLVIYRITDMWVLLDCPNPDDVLGLSGGEQKPRTWRTALVDSLDTLVGFCLDGQLSEGVVTETERFFQQAVKSAKVYRDWVIRRSPTS